MNSWVFSYGIFCPPFLFTAGNICRFWVRPWMSFMKSIIWHKMSILSPNLLCFKEYEYTVKQALLILGVFFSRKKNMAPLNFVLVGNVVSSSHCGYSHWGYPRIHAASKKSAYYSIFKTLTHQWTQACFRTVFFCLAMLWMMPKSSFQIFCLLSLLCNSTN